MEDTLPTPSEFHTTIQMTADHCQFLSSVAEVRPPKIIEFMDVTAMFINPLLDMDEDAELTDFQELMGQDPTLRDQMALLTRKYKTTRQQV